MSEEQFIQVLIEQNNRLMTILEDFAKKEIKFDVVVNSYNTNDVKPSATSKTDNKRTNAPETQVNCNNN